MQGADADNDGVITRDEFVAPPLAMFDRMDSDDDGRLTAQERAEPGMRGGPGGRGMRHFGRGGADLDANRDGTISRAEFDAGGTEMFAHLDTNRDGQLTEADRLRGRPAPPPPAQ